MGATLDALHALQVVERRLGALRSKIDAKKRRVRAAKRAVDKQNLLISEKQAAGKACQMEFDGIDLDVKSREEEMAKHRDALNKAKTNKEYAAILTTINTEKADNAKLESRQLELMTILEAQKAETDTLIEERERLEKKVAATEKDLADTEAACAGDLAKLTAEREVAAQGIDPSILTTFDRVAERHEGEAMAEIVAVNIKRNEYCCGWCNMSLTLEQVIAAETRDEIQNCSSCGIILYHAKSSASA